jgi:hypothetical protein
VNFADEDTAGKGGLGSFPSEPSPTLNGVPPRGRTGSITIDGNAYTTFRSGSITVATARQLSDPEWNSTYQGDPQSGPRVVTADLEMYDDDSANLTALKGKSRSKTPINITIVVGTVAGNIWTYLLKNIVLPIPSYSWSESRRTLRWSGLKARASSVSAKDEIKITLT